MPISIKSGLRVAQALLAGLLVLTAIGSVALRLILPRLVTEIDAIEASISARLGMPVEVGHLQLHWERGLPSLIGDDVRVLRSAQDRTPVLRFNHAEARLDLLESMQAGGLQFGHLRLSELDLKLIVNRDGRLSVEGFPAQDPRVLRWLLQQDGLALDNTRLSLRDEAQRFPPVQAEALDLILSRDENLVRIDGALGDLGDLAGALRLQAELPHGDPTHPDARLRLSATSVNLLDVARRVGLPSTLDTVRSNLWLELGRTGDGLARLAVALTEITTTTDSGASPAPLAGWGLQGLVLLTPSRINAQAIRLWQPGAPEGDQIDWRLSADRAAILEGRPAALLAADHVPSALVAELLRLVGSDETTAVPEVKGQLQNLRLGLRKDGAAWHSFAQGSLSALSVGPAGAMPAIEGLDANFTLRNRNLSAALADESLTLQHPRLIEPLVVEHANATVEVSMKADGGIALAGNVGGVFNALLIQAEGRFAQENRAPGLIDVRVDLGTGDLSRLHSLVPNGALKPGGERWLRKAFPQGVLRGAGIVLKGALQDFPWTEAKAGRFWAQFAVEDTELKYSKDWPSAKAVNGDVAIAGRTLSGSLSTARFGDSPLESARFELPDLFNPKPVMTVEGRIRAQLPDVIATLKDSPLAARSVPPLSPLTLEGEVDLDLDMRLGLKKGMRRDVSGRITFADNTLQTAPGGLRFTEMNGVISFAPEGWSGEALSARLGTRAVGIEVGNVLDANQRPSPSFTLTGTAMRDELLGELRRRAPMVAKLLAPAGIESLIAGELAWRARLSGPPEARRLNLESDLVGVALDLPSPLRKPPGDALAFALEMPYGPIPEDADATTHVVLGNLLQASVRTEGDAAGRRMAQLDLAFGAEAQAVLSEPGIHLHGTLPELALGPWLALLRQSAGDTAALPTRFSLHTERLLTLGQKFPAVSLQGVREEAAWRITVDSPQVAGLVLAPHGPAGGPLVLNLDRLWMSRGGARQPGASREKNAMDPRDLPPLVMACASFHYGTMNLGQASLATSKIAEGLRLDALVFQTPAAQIKTRGSWTRQQGADASHFSIKVKADELAPMLKDFGYDARTVSGGRTVLEIEAGWPGTPGDFTLEKLNGNLSLKVRKGQLLDIEPGSGRLFGLLSVQTLPRRLSFDFADLYRKGYAFDRIEGWFRLEGGNAYTNTLFMEGPSSRVEVRGRIGLAARDYDQRATVTPALSKSIPLASAVFGPAGIGAGAAIYLGQQVFNEVPEQMDKFLQQEYTIKGPWDKPEVAKQ